jgi:predicted nucleic acid-binding protein
VIVVDASAAVSALLNAGSARTTLRSERLAIPHLADAEIANALRRRVLARDITARQGWDALDAWRRLGVRRHSIRALLPRVWELHPNLSAYDAAYVALAEALGCALLTADGRLGRAAGVRCPITVVPR